MFLRGFLIFSEQFVTFYNYNNLCLNNISKLFSLIFRIGSDPTRYRHMVLFGSNHTEAHFVDVTKLVEIGYSESKNIETQKRPLELIKTVQTTLDQKYEKG